MSDVLPLAPLLADVARLQSQAGAASGRHPVLVDALASLEQAVEELHVAAEELQVKNEELMLALRDLDDERQRYRDLFDLAADGYLVTDSRGAVVEANRAAGELMGLPAESLLGCRLVELLAAGSRADGARHAGRARSGQRGEAFLDLAGADESRLVHVRFRPHAEPEGTAPGTARTHWTLVDLERPLFEAEEAADNAAREDPALARRWLRIFGELVAVTESLLEGAADRTDAVSREARLHLLESEVRPLETRLAHLRRRRDHWARRHEGLVGLELDVEAGEVRYRDRAVTVTHREQQLLRFLVQRPGVFYPSRVLLARAWHASYLSEEQVRTYVARLRRKLVDLDLPCELVTRRPQGYALVFR